MKNEGLSNRFNQEELASFWAFNYWEVGSSDSDCFHHIKSPQSTDYVAGEHNTSILNSFPLNNFREHIGKPLHDIAKEKEMIEKVIKVALNSHYGFKEKDIEFLKIYKII